MKTFTLSVSNERYNDKNVIQWDKVKYSRIDDLSLENIAEIITHGNCFTSIFKKANFSVSYKKETNWIGTDFVVFDVDNVKNEITFDEYLKSLKFIPTIIYTTPNCNKQKPTDTKPFSRFRLLYAFETTITDKTIYQGIYDAISNTFDTTLFDTTKKSDNCGNSPVQQFSGNATKNCQITINDVIYNISNFDIKEPTEEPIEKDKIKVRIDDEFLQNLNTLKPTDFLSCYRDKFQIIYESELDYNEEGYALTNDDYVCIERNYMIYKWFGIRKYKCRKLRDGQRRRNTLFSNARIRVQIKPNISIEELIYNLVFDRTYFFNNSDKVLTNQCLLRIALDAKKSKRKMKMKNIPRLRVSVEYCMINNITPKAQKQIAEKLEHYKEISMWYDPTKNVYQNVKIAKEKGNGEVYNTLQKYCFENGINPNGEPQNKAEICDILSVEKVDGTIHQPTPNNTIQRKYKPIKWAKANEYREHCKLYQLFAQRHQLMMSYSKAI